MRDMRHSGLWLLPLVTPLVVVLPWLRLHSWRTVGAIADWPPTSVVAAGIVEPDSVAFGSADRRESTRRAFFVYAMPNTGNLGAPDYERLLDLRRVDPELRDRWRKWARNHPLLAQRGSLVVLPLWTQLFYPPDSAAVEKAYATARGTQH